MKVAIIGGGPIGMEAALYGACAGFDVRLFERGGIAQNIRNWGHVRVFTEWNRNRSPLAVKLLSQSGNGLPPGESTSSGDELADYVESLAQLESLRGRVFPHTEVLALTREGRLKSDLIGDPRRSEHSFRLLLRDQNGERIETADAVLDATGVYGTPNWVGSGGAPCPGELNCKDRIDYAIPDVFGRDNARFADRSTLVVGSGHSAASTLIAIGALFEEYPDTKLFWTVRRNVPSHGFPYTLIPDDPSPHRDELHRRANELSHHPRVRFLHSTVVERIERYGQRFHVELSTRASNRGQGQSKIEKSKIEVDTIAAHTGFRPDKSLWRELQIETHPATDALRPLGEALVAQNRRAGLGLSTGYAERHEAAEPESLVADRWRFLQNDPNLLLTGEPNFFVIGIKSYGRDAGFLMQNGFRQVRDVYKLLSNNPVLDLYEGALDVA